MSLSLIRRSVAVGLCAVALLAVPAYGAIVSARLAVFLAGADSAGNPSSANGQSGPGKSYKDDVSGVIVQVGAAFVKNQSGRQLTFASRGLSVTDPATATNTTPTTFTSTNDLELISRPWFGTIAGAVQIAIYDPSLVPAS